MASTVSNNSGNNYQSSSSKNTNGYRQNTSDSKGNYGGQGSKEPSWLKDYKGFNAVLAELLRLAPNVKLDTRLIYMDGANNVAVVRGLVLDENGVVITRRIAKADLKVSNSLEKAETKALRRACLFAITLLKANAAKNKAAIPQNANSDVAQQPPTKPQQSDAPATANRQSVNPDLVSPIIPFKQPQGGNNEVNTNAKAPQSQPVQTSTNKPIRANTEMLKEAVAFVRKEVKLNGLPELDKDSFEDTVLEISSKQSLKEVAEMLGFPKISELISSLPELSKVGTGQKLSYTLAIIEKFYELANSGNQGPDGNGGGKSPEGNSNQQRSQQLAGAAQAAANNQRSNNNPVPPTQPKFASNLQESEDAFADIADRAAAIAANTFYVPLQTRQPQTKPIVNVPPSMSVTTAFDDDAITVITAPESNNSSNITSINSSNKSYPTAPRPKINRSPNNQQQSLIAFALFELEQTAPSLQDSIQLGQLEEKVAQVTGGWSLDKLAEEIGYSTLTDALIANFPKYEQYKKQNKQHSLALEFFRVWWGVREWNVQAVSKSANSYPTKDKKAAS